MVAPAIQLKRQFRSAPFREVFSSAGCTFVSTAFSDDSKSLIEHIVINHYHKCCIMNIFIYDVEDEDVDNEVGIENDN